jgi:hypothetical protein
MARLLSVTPFLHAQFNGRCAKAGQAHTISLSGKSSAVTIHVASPDGSQTADYVVTVLKPT